MVCLIGTDQDEVVLKCSGSDLSDWEGETYHVYRNGQK